MTQQDAEPDADTGTEEDQNFSGQGLQSRLSASTIYLNTLQGRPNGASIYADPQVEPVLDADADGEMDLDLPDLPWLSSSTTLRSSVLHVFFGAKGADAGLVAPALAVQTRDIFEWASAWTTAAPVGLEWINDISCNVLFEDAALAREAYLALSGMGLDTPLAEKEVERLALDPPLEPIGRDFYDLEASPASPLVAWKSAKPLLILDPSVKTRVKLPTLVRYATTADVKQKGAASRSRFYERHGRTTAQVWNSATKDRDERRSRIDGPSRDNGSERTRSTSPTSRIRSRRRGGMYSEDLEGTTQVVDAQGNPKSLEEQFVHLRDSARGPRALQSRLDRRMPSSPRSTLTLEERLNQPL